MTRSTHIVRNVSVALTLACIVALAGGCAKTARPPQAVPPSAARSDAYPVTITDDASRSVTVASEPVRIVSLAPGNTEILYALGLGDRVVGVTSYDDYPAEVAKVAKVGDFAGPNMEAVAAADPDIVFVTTGVQNDVISKLEELGATVVAIDPQTLSGLYADIERIAAVTNRADQGAQIVSDMRREVAKVQARVAGRRRVTAFVEIGQNPLFTVGRGTLIDELITIAGGENVVVAKGYVPYSAEELVHADPAVYLATKGAASDPTAISERAGYSGLSAVKNGRIVILDDNLVSRPGPRVVLGLTQIVDGLQGAE